jgi:hypothetical protein
MSNVVKLKISLMKRLRIWWNNYVKSVSKRLKYLEEKSKE